jgi:hypothetical protein
MFVMRDVACLDTLAIRYFAWAVSGPGINAPDAESIKRVKYSQLSTALYVFQAKAYETLGAIAASDFSRRLGHKIQTVPQDTRSTRLSVAVQRGNAACVLCMHYCGICQLTEFLIFDSMIYVEAFILLYSKTCCE